MLKDIEVFQLISQVFEKSNYTEIKMFCKKLWF